MSLVLGGRNNSSKDGRESSDESLSAKPAESSFWFAMIAMLVIFTYRMPSHTLIPSWGSKSFALRSPVEFRAADRVGLTPSSLSILQ